MIDDGEPIVSVEQPISRWTRLREKYLERRQVSKVIVFCVTFIAYALFHASRKTLSTVKSTIKSEWLVENSSKILYPIKTWESHEVFTNPHTADNYLGYLDAIFMAIYAAGMYGAGWLGDGWDPRIVVAIGMWGSGITLILFGSVSEWLGLYNLAYYIIMYILFGFFQSFGWPNEVTIMANWFGKENRGFVLGLWSACQSTGNIVGAFIVSLCLPYGYDMAFMVNGVLIFFVGFIFSLVSFRNRQIWVSLKATDALPEMEIYIEDETKERPPAISFLKAVLLPGVLAYCLCNACLKLVNYGFFFWLPFYLDNAYHWSQQKADQLSIWYDVGGIIGSVVGGVITDRLGYRSPVIVFMLIGSLGALYAYSVSPADEVINASLMTIVGLLIGGPYNLIVSTIAADLGSQPQLAGNAEAMSTVTGLVDGTGSLGSAVGQLIVPAIDHTLSWKYVFYLFILMNFLAVLCLSKRFIQDMQGLCCQPKGEERPLLEEEQINGYPIIAQND